MYSPSLAPRTVHSIREAAVSPVVGTGGVNAITLNTRANLATTTSANTKALSGILRRASCRREVQAGSTFGRGAKALVREGDLENLLRLPCSGSVHKDAFHLSEEKNVSIKISGYAVETLFGLGRIRYGGERNHGSYAGIGDDVRLDLYEKLERLYVCGRGFDLPLIRYCSSVS